MPRRLDHGSCGNIPDVGLDPTKWARKAGVEPAQAQEPMCPGCSSPRTWKDGLRHMPTGVIQRYRCRDCGYRFSDPRLNDKKRKSHTLLHQVCASAKNLVTVETREKQAAGATLELSKADVKGAIVEFIWWMKKQGYAEDTVELYVILLKLLIKRGANINDPESVKKVIAMQETWGASRKNNAVKTYSAYLRMRGLSWKKPKYKVPEKLPFIPTESEIDDLIAGCSQQMAAYLQTLKETAARRGEAFNLKWTDIDLVTNTLRVTPEKGSNARIFKFSRKLAGMLINLPRDGESEKVWGYKNKFYLQKTFSDQRKRVMRKLGNPRLRRITFHTLRHWKATMLCQETNGNVYYVMQFLGYKSIVNTMKYIHLWRALYPGNVEYTCEVASTIKEAKKLVEAGFEYVTGEYSDGGKLFRKQKTSLVGSGTSEKGSWASMVYATRLGLS